MVLGLLNNIMNSIIDYKLKKIINAPKFVCGSGEMADAPDLGSGGATREGSSPFSRTI